MAPHLQSGLEADGLARLKALQQFLVVLLHLRLLLRVQPLLLQAIRAVRSFAATRAGGRIATERRWAQGSLGSFSLDHDGALGPLGLFSLDHDEAPGSLNKSFQGNRPRGPAL
eukprot:5114919-Pyramimonas_sp.AAC.1